MTVRAETQIDLARVDDGQSGANGVSVTAVKPQYYLSTSDSSATGGSWSDTPQAFVSGCYYWTRDYVTYSDGTHTTSTAVYNRGMTQASQDAYDARTSAAATTNYFWHNTTDSGNGEGVGAHITEVDQDTFVADPDNGGANTLINSNGFLVREGTDVLAEFNGNRARIGDEAANHFAVTTTSIGLYKGEDRLFNVNKSGHDITMFFADSTDANVPAAGCKYTNAAADEIVAFLTDYCYGDTATLTVKLIADGSDTGYTLVYSTLNTYYVKDPDGDDITCGLYDGVLFNSGAGTFEGNYWLTPKQETANFVNMSACDGSGRFLFSGEMLKWITDTSDIYTAIDSAGWTNDVYNDTSPLPIGLKRLDLEKLLYKVVSNIGGFTEGTTGGWKWRKSSSGMIEAWHIEDFSATTASSWGNIYYHDDTITIPSGIFTSAPQITVTAYQNNNNLKSQWWVGGISDVSTTGFTLRRLKPNSNSQAGKAFIYAVQV